MPKPVDRVEFWKERIDTAAKDYFTVYVTSEGDWHRINKAHEAIIKKLIKPEDRVLDAGCAYARMSKLFSDEQYVGVDFSPDFIEMAKRNFPAKEFLIANLKNLPFRDDEFDWAFCTSIKAMVVNNLGQEEWDQMEKELTRVAKKLLILEYENPNPYEIVQKNERTCYENS